MALISTTGPICPNVTNTPLDNRSRVSTYNGIGSIPLAWKGMLVYCEENGNTYKVTSLKPKTGGPVDIENYYPATWVEFGSGGSSPSPTPSAIDAGDVTYSSSGTFSNGTVGKELQSLASDISGLSEDTHNLSGDIGTLRSLSTDYQQDLVGAINEVLGITNDKVAGIKVQGGSGVLPMDRDGIVTIPAGGGGTGTITGATVGGSQVPETGGILQFQAYPTVPVKSIQVYGAQSPLSPDGTGKVTIPAQPDVPIKGIKDANNNTLTPDIDGIVTLPQAAAAPTADTMTYNNSTTYSNGSIGKALHDTITALGYEYSPSSTIATNPSHNMYYNLTGSAISALDVSDVSPTNDKEIIILFLTNSSNGCSITLAETPTPQRIIGSTALAKGQVYIMSILRGVVCLVEAPVYVQPASNS